MNMPTPDRPGFFEDRHVHLPHGTGVFGMWLFLIALGILFASSMAGYVIIRLTTLDPVTHPVTGVVLRQAGPALGSVRMPPWLWLSTAVILVSSFTIQMALRAVRKERLAQLRKYLTATLVLAVLFLIVQTPSLIALLGEHQAHRLQLREEVSLALMPSGMIFFLIVLHGLHLIGGIIPLGIVTRNARLNRYDHESHNPVHYVAMYWHFLDAVWISLFAGLLLIG